jgi:hypothetical protein
MGNGLRVGGVDAPHLVVEDPEARTVGLKVGVGVATADADINVDIANSTEGRTKDAKVISDVIS